MTTKILLYVLGFGLFLAPVSFAQAQYTELGFSYGRDDKTFDANNKIDSESMTGSISFYFLERFALELSYTDATTIRKEKASATDPQRNITQKATVMGADLVMMLADKKAFLQPFIKGGGAQISRKQEIDIEGFGKQTLEPESATVPSYGFGLKILLTDALNLKFSYNIWQTPIGGGAKTDDTALKAGISWIL